MKKMITAILFISAISFTAHAQQAECHMNKAGMKGKHGFSHAGGKMKGQLNLNDAQKEQMKTIHQDTRRQMDALRENRQMTLQQYDDSRARILKEQKSKMDNLLTAEQKTTRERLKAENELQRKQAHEKKLDGMKARLSLSDAQVNQLKSLREKNHEAIKAIKANENMGPDAKRSAMKKIKDQAKEDRKSIFTAEQLKKLEENKGGFHKRRGDVK